MDELKTLNTDTQTVSARELHEKLGIKTKFPTWFERMTEYGFSENVDFKPISQKWETAQGNMTTSTDYEISMDMAKEICMIQRTPEGKKVRQYLIDLEKAWNTPEQVMSRALKIADETINRLQTDVEKLTKDNKRMKPKEIFTDAVMASKQSILVGQLAKILRQNGIEDIGQNKLFDYLRWAGYLIKQRGQNWNMPTQKSIDRGLFEIRESIHTNADGTTVVRHTPVVTPKGQMFFINGFLRED